MTSGPQPRPRARAPAALTWAAGRVRRLPDALPLRVKLVAVVVALVTVALAAVAFAATASLNRDLVRRADADLEQVARRFAGEGGTLADGPVPGARRGGARNGGPLADGRFGDRRSPPLPSEFVFVYVDSTGQPVQVSRNPLATDTPDEGLPRVPLARTLGSSGRPFTVESVGSDAQWRVVATPLPDGAGSFVVARGLADVQRTVSRLVFLELVIGAAVVLLLAGVGYLVVQRSLRPLAEVEQTAAAIAGGELSRRVPDRDPRTEVGRLSVALNGMLGQIERAFRVQQASEASARRSEEQMRQFVADASHELRTPLTSIRGFAELYRQGAATREHDPARLMRRIEDEAARMGLLVDDLLLLARLDQQRPLERQPVDLLAVATDAVHDARAVHPARPVNLDVTGTDPPVVLGDEPRLRQVLGNLLGNALTHTPEGTPVTVRVGSLPGAGAGGRWAVLEVADRGPGLAPKDAERVFERFYRADASRNRSHGGTGLGLSIVAGLTAAHGGKVELETEPGRGATFRVLLPLAV